MKLLKGIVITLTVLLTFTLALAVQLNYALGNTLLSGKYFINTFDKAGMSRVAGNYAASKLKELNTGNALEFDGIKLNGFNNAFTGKIDVDWLGRQASTALKGLYSFAAGDTSTLPVLDIKPLKECFLDTLTDEMLKRDDVKSALTGLKTVAGLLKGEYRYFVTNGVISNILIDQVMKSNDLKNLGVDRQTLVSALNKYSEAAGKGTATSRIDRELVRNVIVKRLDYGKVRNTFDMNLFMSKAYTEKYNPLIKIRNIAALYKKISVRIIIVTVAALILMFGLGAIQRRRLLKFAAVSLIVAGVAGAIIGLFVMLSTSISELLARAASDSSLGLDSASLTVFETWLSSFLKGVFVQVFISGLILAAVGIAAFIAVHIFSSIRKTRFKTVPYTGKTGTSAAIGITVAFVLLIAIFVNAFINIKAIAGEVNRFGTTQETGIEAAGGMNFNAAVAEVTGADFIKELK